MKMNQLLKLIIGTLAFLDVTFIAVTSRAQTEAVFEQNANGQSLGSDSCGSEHFASNNSRWTQSQAFGLDCNNNSYLADVSNWNIANYPNGANFNVTIGLSAHLNESVAMGNLTITSSGALVADANNSAGGGAHNVTFTLNGGTLTNNGTLTSIGVAEAGQTYTFATDTLLTGTGTTTFGYSTTLNGPGILTIDSAQNVIGGGADTVNLSLVNHGNFNANGSSAFFNHPEVSFMSSQITNTGTMRTTAGGVIQFLTNTAIDNTGGTLSANGDNWFYLNSGVAVTGGTLSSSGDPARNDLFRVTGATLNGVTIADATKMLVTGLLTLNGAIYNGGQIFVSDQGGSLGVNTDTILSGTGVIIIQQSDNIIALGKTLTLGSEQSLYGGFVGFNGAINNHGFINAGSDRGLFLYGGNFGNNGTIQSNGNGHLYFGERGTPAERTFTIDNTGGTIQALDTSTIDFNGDILLRNGILGATSGAVVFMQGALTLENVTHTGVFHFRAPCSYSVTLNLSKSFTNNGAIDDTTGACVPFTINLLGDVNVDGNGYMALYRNTLIDSSNGGVMTNGASHSIAGGSGTTIQASLVNNGEVSSGCCGTQLNLNSPIVTNNGVLGNHPDGVLQQAGNSVLTNYDATTQTLTGGTYRAFGQLNLNIGPITTNAATVILSGNGSFPPINSIQQNLGTLAILGGRSFSTPTASGEFKTDVLDVADLANAGTIKLDENSALNVSGNYSQGSNSRLYIEIGSNGPNPNFHQLNVGGAATLAGTLDVRLVNGFVPGPTQTFPIINAASISGGFTQVHGADVTVTANGVSIHPNGAPIPLAITSAVSRKTHQAPGTIAGTFDVNLPLVGPAGVECRSGGAANNHTLVFTFNNDVVSGTAAVTDGTATLAGPPVFPGNPSINNIPRNTMIVNLTGVTNAQTLTLKLSGMTDVANQVLPDTLVSVTFLVGDTSGNKTVNSTDVSTTKVQSGHVVTNSNAREDVDANGAINGTDVSTVKLHVGSGVP